MKNTLNEIDLYTTADDKETKSRADLPVEIADDHAEDEETVLLTEEYLIVQGWL